MGGILIFFGVIIAVVVGLLIVIAVLKHRADRFLKSNMGISLEWLGNEFKKDIANTKALPVHDMSALYKLEIEKKFPEMGFDEMLSMAKTALLQTFECLEKESTDFLTINCAMYKPKLAAQIEVNRQNGQRLDFEDVSIHKCVISSFNTTAKTATARFEISVQYYSKDGKKADKRLVQAVYAVALAYNQDDYLDGNQSVYASNCPNCGAPVSAVGDNIFCEYCGSGITAISSRIWQVSEVLPVKQK